MKTFSRAILPRIVGLLFAAQAVLSFCFHFDLLHALLCVPVFVLLAVLLLRCKRGTPLAIAAVLLALARLMLTKFITGLPNAESYWGLILWPALACELLLMAFVLFNTVPKLKKYRFWVNKLWFLPGAAALVTVIYVCFAFDASVLLCEQILAAFGLGILELLGVLLLPLWLAWTAEDDLLPYQEMLGSLITPEELEAKRRELGLAGHCNDRSF